MRKVKLKFRFLVDENGMLWRRHEDGEVDWWDRASLIWKRW